VPDATITPRPLLLDEATFQDAIDAHGAAIYRYAVAQVGAQHADDLLAETFAVAWASRAKYTDGCGSGLEAWLITIARVLAAAHHRTERRWRRMRVAATRHRADHIGEHEEADALDRLDAATLMERAQVHELLRELPERERDPLLLHVLEGYTYEEISELLEVPVGTVRSRISRGRVRLRTRVLFTVLALLLVLAAVAAARSDRVRTLFGNSPADPANQVTAFERNGSDLAVFREPVIGSILEAQSVDNLFRHIPDMETSDPAGPGEPMPSQLRELVRTDEVRVLGLPTTTGHVCFVVVRRFSSLVRRILRRGVHERAPRRILRGPRRRRADDRRRHVGRRHGGVRADDRRQRGDRDTRLERLRLDGAAARDRAPVHAA
jgi:RNA polymerase sigma-70 factor (ECF subfamily)